MNIIRDFNKNNKKYSYSQCGEDIIVKFIFDVLKIKKPSYIDIGAHDPFFLSNTALLYDKGSTGINIEANPKALGKFNKFRKKDINLNIGISDKTRIMNFYIMSSPTMNTFSEEEANRLVEENKFRILDVIKVPTDKLSNVINKYCDGRFPDFLTIDVEGIEMEILEDIDYDKEYPKVICCETISYSDSGNGIKEEEIINFLKNKGYMLYADTYINSIFVREDLWKSGV